MSELTEDDVHRMVEEGNFSALLSDVTPAPRAPAPEPLPAGLPQTQISMRLPTDLLGHFDFIADRDGTSRSDLIRVAMVEYLYRRAANPVQTAEVEHALDVLRGALLRGTAEELRDVA